MTRTVVHLEVISQSITGKELKRKFGFEVFCHYNTGEFKKLKKGGFLRIPEKDNGIIIHSRLNEKEEYEEHVKDILSQIRVCGDTFTELGDNISTILGSCTYVKYSNNEYPEPPRFHLEKELISELGNMNISLDYDSYIYPADEA